MRPYETTMLAHVKAAWSGRPLLDVLSSNYDRFPPEYWVQTAHAHHRTHAHTCVTHLFAARQKREAVQDGRITLNGAKTDQDTVVPVHIIAVCAVVCGGGQL